MKNLIKKRNYFIESYITSCSVRFCDHTRCLSQKAFFINLMSCEGELLSADLCYFPLVVELRFTFVPLRFEPRWVLIPNLSWRLPFCGERGINSLWSLSSASLSFRSGSNPVGFSSPIYHEDYRFAVRGGLTPSGR